MTSAAMPDDGEADEGAVPASWGLPPKARVATPSADALKPLLPLLRQLREIKGVRETLPGRFAYRQITLVQFIDNAGVVVAELKKAGGSGIDRYPLDTPAQRRKLIDDAKRRAAALDDE